MLAGLGIVATPLVANARPAAAATTTDERAVTFSFIDFASQTVTCDLDVSASHNTDDPDNPSATMTAQVTSDFDPFNECPMVSLTMTFSYKDGAGVQRKSVTHLNVASATQTITGTFAPITAKARAQWLSCNPMLNPCATSVTAAPK